MHQPGDIPGDIPWLVVGGKEVGEGDGDNS